MSDREERSGTWRYMRVQGQKDWDTEKNREAQRAGQGGTGRSMEGWKVEEGRRGIWMDRARQKYREGQEGTNRDSM